mmetsp:Transcript_38423/g.100579  ORF Transcript_38423/g.100579 Transcript_38423/m.100579 type:complete len:220 (-) Transcript_38423:5-664(-)
MLAESCFAYIKRPRRQPARPHSPQAGLHHLRDGNELPGGLADDGRVVVVEHRVPEVLEGEIAEELQGRVRLVPDLVAVHAEALGDVRRFHPDQRFKRPGVRGQPLHRLAGRHSPPDLERLPLRGALDLRVLGESILHDPHGLLRQLGVAGLDRLHGGDLDGSPGQAVPGRRPLGFLLLLGGHWHIQPLLPIQIQARARAGLALRLALRLGCHGWRRGAW